MLNTEYRILLLWMRVMCTGTALTLQGPHGSALGAQVLRLCSERHSRYRDRMEVPWGPRC